MNRLAICTVLVSALVVGCQESETKDKPSSAGGTNEMQAKQTAKPAPTPAGASAPLKYQEVKVGNKVYVVGSDAAAEKARAGKLEKPVRVIGIGQPDEKVYFEEANQAALEAEYAKRHGGR